MSIWARGDAYEPYVGRWSRLVAAELLDWLGVPPGRRWLDVGCGTGALSATILALARPSALTGLDASAEYVAHVAQRLPDGRADFRVGDAQELPFGPSSFDAAVSGLVLNFLPRPERGLAEMLRVTRPGGEARTRRSSACSSPSRPAPTTPASVPKVPSSTGTSGRVPGA